MRNFKKIISLVLCVALAASMCLTALADEVENVSTTQQDAVVENATADKATEETTEPEQAETTGPEKIPISTATLVSTDKNFVPIFSSLLYSLIR